MMRETNDRLDVSRYGLLAISLVTIAAFVVMLLLHLDTGSRSMQTTQRLIKGLSLDTPAIIPSGRALRSAGYLSPAIDLRHGPHLPLIHFSPEEMTVGGFNPADGTYY